LNVTSPMLILIIANIYVLAEVNLFYNPILLIFDFLHNNLMINLYEKIKNYETALKVLHSVDASISLEWSEIFSFEFLYKIFK